LRGVKTKLEKQLSEERSGRKAKRNENGRDYGGMPLEV